MSDHAVFYGRGVPALCFSSGINRDLHKPSDTPDKIDVNRTMQVLNVIEGIAVNLWTSPERVKYQRPWAYKMQRAGKAGAGSDRGYLGVLADDESSSGPKPGCRLTRMIEGSPAHKAGLKAGDLIRKCDEVEILSPAVLRQVISTHKPGDVVRIKLLRRGAALEMHVKLSRKQP